jgi:hypothetical protein
VRLDKPQGPCRAHKGPRGGAASPLQGPPGRGLLAGQQGLQSVLRS